MNKAVREAYDKETDHGRKATEQGDWEAKYQPFADKILKDIRLDQVMRFRLSRPRARLVLATLGCLSAIACLTGVQGNPKPDEPVVPLLRLTAKLDKTEVEVGGKVKITVTAPVALEASLIGITHQPTIIGNWDQPTREFVVLRDNFRFAFSDRYFDGLSALLFSHPIIDFDIPLPAYVETATEKGMVREFSAKKPGIYLLTQTWENRHTKAWYISNPVVLMVRGK